MKVIILTRRNSTSYYIVNRLDSANKYHIIVENDDKSELFYKKIRRFIGENGFIRGILKFLNLLLEMPYIIKETRKFASYIDEKLNEHYFNPSYEVHGVSNINNPKVVGIINKIDPKVIIVIGTRIIKEHIIKGVSKENRYFVNWHSGITPEYRGCKPEFYSIINDELDMVGSTIHYIDKGVDTGEIVAQENISLNDEEEKYKYDYQYLRYKNILLAVKMFNEFLKNVIEDKLKPVSKTFTKSRLFSTPMKKDYLKYYQIFKKKVSSIS